MNLPCNYVFSLHSFTTRALQMYIVSFCRFIRYCKHIYIGRFLDLFLNFEGRSTFQVVVIETSLTVLLFYQQACVAVCRADCQYFMNSTGFFISL